MKEQTQPPAAEAAAVEETVAAIANEIASPATDTTDSDVLAELGRIQSSLDSRVFGSLEDVFKTEELEQLGVEHRWRDLPDAYVTIAHYSTMNEKREQLEKRFREKYSIPETKPLERRVHEALVREAMYGTVVRGWRGESFADFPFNEANCRRLIGARRFRIFAIGKSNSAEGFRARRAEDLSGN